MAKYELRTATGWRETEPTPELKALLDAYRDSTVSIDNGPEWRVKPRDEQLVKDIAHLVAITSVGECAEAIYELLEQKGLV